MTGKLPKGVEGESGRGNATVSCWVGRYLELYGLETLPRAVWGMVGRRRYLELFGV